jgi:FkbM family methyltransferase
MIKDAIQNFARPFIPSPIRRFRQRLRAAAIESSNLRIEDERWRSILSDDGLYHWNDLNFDLRRDGKTLFIRDEILDGGEYDFHSPKSCVVVDIGMNIGDTPLYFARMPHVTKVYAFEPMQATYDWVVENFALNPKYSGKIVAHRAAVSDNSGFLEIDLDYQDGTGGASVEIVNDEHRKAIESAGYILNGPDRRKQNVRVEDVVEVVRSIRLKHPGDSLVVKCDAEGAEWKIMPALFRNGLFEQISIFMVEYHYQAPAPILDMLTKSGFVSFVRDLKILKKAEIGNIYAVKAYSD